MPESPAQEARRIAETWLRDTEAGGVTDHSDTAKLARAYIELAQQLEQAERGERPKGGLTREQVERYGPGGSFDSEQAEAPDA